MTAATTHHHPPMSATVTLTNCYVPLSSTDTSTSSNFDPSNRPTDDNHDGNTLSHPKDADSSTTTNQKQQSRGPRTLRHIHLSKSILSQSTGSSLVEWGHTKLLVSVRGPRPINCSSMNAANNGGGLVCEGEFVCIEYILRLFNIVYVLVYIDVR